MNDVVVVLGAGMGGRAVALAMRRKHVVIVDRTPALAQAVVKEAVAAGGSVEAATIDLLDLAAVESFRDELLDRLGRVDAVIHLVGGWRGSRTVDEKALEDWAALEPGIAGTVRTTSVAFRAPLSAAPRGRYVMVSSTSVDRPTAGNAAYASAKAAAETWVRALGHAFRGTPARACIVSVSALVDDAMRAANPERRFAGATDTRDLAAAVAQLLDDDSVESGSRVVLGAS